MSVSVWVVVHRANHLRWMSAIWLGLALRAQFWYGLAVSRELRTVSRRQVRTVKQKTVPKSVGPRVYHGVYTIFKISIAALMHQIFRPSVLVDSQAHPRMPVRRHSPTQPVRSPYDPRFPATGWEWGVLPDGRYYFFRSEDPDTVCFALHPCRVLGCAYAARSSSALSKHMKTHDKPQFVCPSCHTSFYQKAHLQWHGVKRPHQLGETSCAGLYERSRTIANLQTEIGTSTGMFMLSDEQTVHTVETEAEQTLPIAMAVQVGDSGALVSFLPSNTLPPETETETPDAEEMAAELDRKFRLAIKEMPRLDSPQHDLTNMDLMYDLYMTDWE